MSKLFSSVSKIVRRDESWITKLDRTSFPPTIFMPNFVQSLPCPCWVICIHHRRYASNERHAAMGSQWQNTRAAVALTGATAGLVSFFLSYSPSGIPSSPSSSISVSCGQLLIELIRTYKSVRFTWFNAPKNFNGFVTWSTVPHLNVGDYVDVFWNLLIRFKQSAFCHIYLDKQKRGQRRILFETSPNVNIARASPSIVTANQA